MARNRQRSKQRQAERRARRLEQEGVAPPPEPRAGIPGVDADLPPNLGGPGIDPDLVDGAPPEELGRSDYTLEQEQDELEAGQHLAEDDLPDEDAPTGAGEAGYAVRGRRATVAADAHKHRPRVVQFLIACWAELQRVQWPNRQALVTLTGVVLGFVLIAGGYLGLLDAIFSELIQAIL